MTEIKKGNYYVCLKDIKGYDSFTKGKVYKSLYDNALINDNHIEVLVKPSDYFQIATKQDLRKKKKEFNIKCPKCGYRRIWLMEVIEAASEHFINDGVWVKSYYNNEYGKGIRVDLMCDSCGHRWTGRKGVTIDCYRIK